MALATRMAQQPPQSLRLAKTLLRHGTTSSYETIMELSAASQSMMHYTDDHMEGVNAILEKGDGKEFDSEALSCWRRVIS